MGTNWLAKVQNWPIFCLGQVCPQLGSPISPISAILASQARFVQANQLDRPTDRLSIILGYDWQHQSLAIRANPLASPTLRGRNNNLRRRHNDYDVERSLPAAKLASQAMRLSIVCEIRSLLACMHSRHRIDIDMQLRRLHCHCGGRHAQVAAHVHLHPDGAK